MAFHSNCTCTWDSSGLGHESMSEKRGGSRRSRLGCGPCWRPVGSKSCSVVLKGLGREVVVSYSSSFPSGSTLQGMAWTRSLGERFAPTTQGTAVELQKACLTRDEKEEKERESRSCSLRNLVICSRMIWCKNFLACNFEAISTARACSRC